MTKLTWTFCGYIALQHLKWDRNIGLYDPYMPYLTVWDKISQNLTHLEASSHKIFHISQNFQTILQHILWRNNHKPHFVVFITSFLHLNKGFWLLLGSSKVIFVKISQNFIKSPLKICLIPKISVHSLWHVWWPHVAMKISCEQPSRCQIVYGIKIYIVSFA